VEFAGTGPLEEMVIEKKGEKGGGKKRIGRGEVRG